MANEVHPADEVHRASDVLADFTSRDFEALGKRRTVFEIGDGPAVIVITEMPGITPAVADFARRVAAIGCTAVMPHLFGDPWRAPTTGSNRPDVGAFMRSIVPACISREFHVLATGTTSPVVDWLRELARDAHGRCGGPGVGAVGMCFTGGFALAMATDDRLLAPVLSQPSLPFGITKGRRGSIDISPDDLATVRERCGAGLEVIGLRFEGDKLVPPERFEFLRRELGEAFVAIELPDDSANPEAPNPPHSVLTEHLVDEPGEPTRAALDRVLELFRSRLLTTA
ncbi:MAG: dienelactone hydrolase [Acidimicrobiaceae bacterium]|nr:dienelactone hydrolase [Acidimicrobiaceae bacterium]